MIKLAGLFALLSGCQCLASSDYLRRGLLLIGACFSNHQGSYSLGVMECGHLSVIVIMAVICPNMCMIIRY